MALTLFAELKAKALPRLLAARGVNRPALESLDALASTLRHRAPPFFKASEVATVVDFVSKVEGREIDFHPAACGGPSSSSGGSGGGSGGGGGEGTAPSPAAIESPGAPNGGSCDATLRALAFAEADNIAAAWRVLRSPPLALDASASAAVLAAAYPDRLAWVPAPLMAFLSGPAGKTAVAGVDVSVLSASSGGGGSGGFKPAPPPPPPTSSSSSSLPSFEADFTAHSRLFTSLSGALNAESRRREVWASTAGLNSLNQAGMEGIADPFVTCPGVPLQLGSSCPAQETGPTAGLVEEASSHHPFSAFSTALCVWAALQERGEAGAAEALQAAAALPAPAPSPAPRGHAPSPSLQKPGQPSAATI